MVKIRLMRMGAKKRPYFRVVVADSRSPRDGRFIENIGKYHPMSHPSVIEIDEERALHWLGNGAQPTEAVKNLLVKSGVWDKFQGGPGTPVPPPPERKRAPKVAAEAAEGETQEAAAEAPEAPEAPEEPEEPAGEGPSDEADDAPSEKEADEEAAPGEEEK